MKYLSLTALPKNATAYVEIALIHLESTATADNIAQAVASLTTGLTTAIREGTEFSITYETDSYSANMSNFAAFKLELVQ